MDVNLKNYIRHFRFYFLAILILAVIWALLFVINNRDSQTAFVRTNQECTTQERVFDYADVLNDSQEADLRALISEKEAQTGCDIVLVTLNESLEDYAKAYESGLGYLEPYQYTMVYADNFYDEHLFGYDKPYGDGVLLLDNWYREADGNVYSWLSTCGRAEAQFSEGMIERLLDQALENVDEDPYGAYREYVTLFAQAMTQGMDTRVEIPIYVPVLGALIAAGIYIGVNLQMNKGMKTVNLNTYVKGGRPRMKRKEDIFLRKTVSKRHIERNSGSGGGGGGGHHVSSGGVSHGGGGHSR